MDTTKFLVTPVFSDVDYVNNIPAYVVHAIDQRTIEIWERYGRVIGSTFDKTQWESVRVSAPASVWIEPDALDLDQARFIHSLTETKQFAIVDGEVLKGMTPSEAVETGNIEIYSDGGKIRFTVMLSGLSVRCCTGLLYLSEIQAEYALHSTPMPQDTYAVDGQTCPNCKSKDHIIAALDDFQTIGTKEIKGQQRIHCLGCSASWTDEWKLVGYSDLILNDSREE